MKSLKSNSEPLVTIGIPTYNRPIELQKAIEASINQSYRNLEIIISDNCSPDPKVEKLCREYAERDNRIKYTRHSKNRGMGTNGEYVISQATGEYFIWCMDDDWLSCNFIQESITFILKNPNYSIVFGDMNFYNLDYSLIRQCPQISFEEEDANERIKKYSKTAIVSSLSFGLTKTILMQEVFVNKMRLPADWIFMMKTLFLGKGKYLSSISYNALNNGSSKDIDGLRKAFSLPHLTHDNFWQIMSENIVEAVLFDDFFVEKISKEERIYLALNINNILMSIDKNNNFFNKLKNKLKRILYKLINKG